MRRTAVTILCMLMGVVGAATTGAAVTAAPAMAATADGPYCGLHWGSLPKEVTPGSTGVLTGVRAGRHGCFDRLVLDVDGEIAGYTVRYVDRITMDGSGDPVAVRGGARLEVVARVASNAIARPGGDLTDVSRYRTFRQVVWAGSFEGQSTIGLGVRARLPFRVLLLDGPGTGSRMVVDVANRW